MNIAINTTPQAACTLGDCEPGLFLFQGKLCLKTAELNYWGYFDIIVCETGKDFYLSDFSNSEELELYKIEVLPIKFSVAIEAEKEQLPLDWTDDLSDSQKDKALLKAIANGFKSAKQIRKEENDG